MLVHETLDMSEVLLKNKKFFFKKKYCENYILFLIKGTMVHKLIFLIYKKDSATVNRPPKMWKNQKGLTVKQESASND